MVHKRTEYRTNFQWTSPGKRQEIFEENLKFRNLQKLKEFSHEPFEWKGWDCTCDSDEECSCKLLRQTGKVDASVSTKDASGVPEKKPLSEKQADKCVQTPEIIRASSPEKGVQTDPDNMYDIKVPTAMKEDSTQTDPELNMTLTFADNAHASTPIVKVPGCRFTVKTLVRDGRKIPERPSSCGARMKSRRTLPEKRSKSPFLSYGWADSVKEVGAKQTYNIMATKNVHPSARQAFHNKLTAVDWYTSRNYIVPIKNEQKLTRVERHSTPNISSLFNISIKRNKGGIHQPRI